MIEDESQLLPLYIQAVDITRDYCPHGIRIDIDCQGCQDALDGARDTVMQQVMLHTWAKEAAAVLDVAVHHLNSYEPRVYLDNWGHKSNDKALLADLQETSQALLRVFTPPAHVCTHGVNMFETWCDDMLAMIFEDTYLGPLIERLRSNLAFVRADPLDGAYIRFWIESCDRCARVIT